MERLRRQIAALDSENKSLRTEKEHYRNLSLSAVSSGSGGGLNGAFNIPIPEVECKSPVVSPRLDAGIDGDGNAAGRTHGTAAVDDMVTVPFTEDSPFFRREISDEEKRIKSLHERLDHVAKLSQAVARAGEAFSKAAGDLGRAVSDDWTPYEKDPDSDVSLHESMQKLGLVLDHTSTIMGHLALSCDAFLAQSIDSSLREQKDLLSDTGNGLQEAQNNYENALSSYLSTKKDGKEKKKKNGGVNGSGLDESITVEEQLNNLRRQFELARFDHVETINTIHTDKVVDVVECTCASFFGFITFFHSGEYHVHSMKPEIEELNVKIQERKREFEKRKETVRSNRDKLERGLSLPSFLIRDAFPDLREGEHRVGVALAKTNERNLKVEKQGYLLKQSSSVRKDWKRRWFVLQDGKLYYFRGPNDLEPQHVVNVLICTVRPTVEKGLQFCFELISPTKRTYLLQAQSAEEMRDWIEVFQNCTENLLQNQEHVAPSSASRRMSTASFEKYEEVTNQMMVEIRSENQTCVDCGARSKYLFVSCFILSLLYRSVFLFCSWILRPVLLLTTVSCVCFSFSFLFFSFLFFSFLLLTFHYHFL